MDTSNEKELIALLKSKHFSKDELAYFSSAIVDLRRRGFVIDRIWRYGIPFPDGIRVAGSVPGASFPKLGELLLDGRYSQFRGFPKGIPRPIELAVDVHISLPEIPGEIPAQAIGR